MEINNILVGSRIKNIRTEKGMNQEEFGSKIGNAHKSLVSKWEKGQNLPNNERLKLITELGDITVEELLYGVLEEDISFINNKALLEKKLDDTYNELKIEVEKFESRANESLTEELSEELDISNVVFEGFKRARDKYYNKVKDQYLIYVLNGVVYLMDQESDLNIKDFNIDSSYYDTIKVEKRTEKGVNSLLQEEKIIDTEHIIDVINKYHDYNVDIKLSRELTWDSMISDYDQILNY